MLFRSTDRWRLIFAMSARILFNSMLGRTGMLELFPNRDRACSESKFFNKSTVVKNYTNWLKEVNLLISLPFGGLVLC